jgi:hypothetical protein
MPITNFSSSSSGQRDDPLRVSDGREREEGSGVNVKAGDLAIVICADVTPEIIGSIVEVVRIAVQGEYFSDVDMRFESRGGRPAWVVKRSNGLLPWRTVAGALRWADMRPLEDSLLRPVSGLPIEEDTNTEERVPA